MKFGDIFKEITKSKSARLDLISIEKKAVKKASFKRYGNNIVSKRGNVFKNSVIDIDAIFDKKLASL